jgi:hypothetical protein
MKSLWLMMIAWSMPSPANAGPEPSVALKGGVGAATTAADSSANKYGFTGGLAGSLQWLLTDGFSLAGQTELLYAPRGPKVVSEGEYLGKFRLHYFDVTIAARPGAQLGPTSVYLLLGGGLNFLLSANRENASGANQDITGDLRRVDVALLAGAGVALQLPAEGMGPLRLGTVFLEVRHDHGLLPADAVNDGLKNRTSSLMLGLSFALSGERAASPASSSARSDSPSPAAAAVPAE